MLQAEDRAHRIGQPSSVNVYFLHVKQSVDDLMWTLIQNKLDNVGQARFPLRCFLYAHSKSLDDRIAGS